MKKTKLLILLGVLVSSLACGLFSQTEAAPTVQPTATKLFTLVATAYPTLVPANTLVPTQAPTAVPTLGPASFTAFDVTNCRSGPSTDFEVASILDAGQTVQIMGKGYVSPYLWWLVNNQGIGCWIRGDLGSTQGNTDIVPQVAIPILPTTEAPVIDVVIQNNTGGGICEVDFYKDGAIAIPPITWEKRQFKDGDYKVVKAPVGEYSLITAYNCKDPLQKIGSIKHVFLDGDHNTISFEQ